MKRILPALCVCLVFSACDCNKGPDPNNFPERDFTYIPFDMSEPDGSMADAPATSGCGETGESDYVVGSWTIHFNGGNGSWRARPTDADSPGFPLSGAPSCLESPAVALLDDPPVARHAFGNFDIDLTGESTWIPNERRTPAVSSEPDKVTLKYAVNGHQADLVFTDDGAAGLRVELEHDAESAELRLRCDAGESFFGLGTQATGMDLRGRTYPLWTQEQGNGKPEGGGMFPFNNTPEAAYAPMGVLHSTSGWSGIVTHDGYTEVDLCNTDPQYLAIRSHKANPGFVFVSGSPRERMTAVTAYTGRVRDDVPPWAFGLWVDSVTGPDRLAAVTSALRDNQIPASAIWSEDWIGGSTSAFGFRLSYDWVWDEAQYPNLPTLVDDLHARGFAFLAYFNTFVPQPTSIFPIATAMGYLVKDADGEPILFGDPAFRNSGLVDLFNPAAVAWLKTYQLTAVTDIGIDGWMADFSEWYPLEAPDAWEKHNVFPLEWQRVNDAHMREARPDGNYVFFPRSGWASVNGGSGGVAPVMWGGDQNTNWAYDDGFPTIVPIGAHVGLSGVPIFGSDIAGYNTIGNFPNTTKELWFRWASTAAFHPLMRTHHGGDECANWNFDRDAETIAHLRRWSSIHSLLLPEFQRLHSEASVLGWPITRHPWLVEPDNTALWTGDQYGWFLGDDIWVAPVLTEGATTRDVLLPGDGWWPLLGTSPAASGTADVPVTEVAAYVRPGRALVLLADPVDSFYGASDATVSDLDDAAARFRVALYPDADGNAGGQPGPFDVGGRGLDAFAASGAMFNNVALPDCAVPVAESCIDGSVVRLVDVTAGSLVAGGATVDFDSVTPVTVTVGIGGAAWEGLATPTSYAPNPDAPSWCPPE